MPDHLVHFTMKTGFVESRERVLFVAQIDQLAKAESTASTMLQLTVATDAWASAHVDWSAVRVVSIDPPRKILLLGIGGEILDITPGGPRVLVPIDDGKGGPKFRGPMRDLRLIDGEVYAAGMSRQVYRREVGGLGEADAGTVLKVGEKKIAGFNSIDGLSEDDLLAVGFGGEIWRREKGKWRQLDSPTGVVLNRVRVVKKNLAYAIGQKGVLLQGKGDAWTVLRQQATTDDLWGLEWFDGSLYVCSSEELFKLNAAGDLDPVNQKLGKDRTFYDLSAGDGVLWTIGPKHLAWTTGAKARWTDVTS